MDALITARIGDRVKIRALDKPAHIQAILQSADGIQYQISFWNDADRKVEWVFPYEICMMKATVAA